MFQKIVSQLSFSPAMVAKIGVYARRLRQTQRQRRFSIAVLIALIVLYALTLLVPAHPLRNSLDEMPPALRDSEQFMQQFWLPDGLVPLAVFTGVLVLSLVLRVATHTHEEEVRIIRKQLNSGGPQ